MTINISIQQRLIFLQYHQATITIIIRRAHVKMLLHTETKETDSVLHGCFDTVRFLYNKLQKS